MTNDSPVWGSQTDSSHSPYRRKIDPDSYFGPKPEGIPASRKAWFRTVLWTNPTPKSLPRTGRPNLNIVSDYIRPQRLSAEEEAKLIELARAGDQRAARGLVLAHTLFIRGRAGKRWSKLNRTTGQAPPRMDRAVEYDDFVASGLLALAQAIRNYEPGNNKLNAFARKGINGAIADTLKDWGNAPGFGGMDSRIQRFIRSHPHWPADWIRMKFPNFSLERIEWEQSTARPVTDSYSEVGEDNDGHYVFGDDGVARQETPGTESLEALDSPAASGWSRKSAGGYRWREKNALRNGQSWLIGYTPGHKPRRVYGSLWDDNYQHYHDRRLSAHLKGMGRQRFTEWRMEHAPKANSGDWMNGEWHPTERKRLADEKPAPWKPTRYRKKTLEEMNNIVELRRPPKRAVSKAAA